MAPNICMLYSFTLSCKVSASQFPIATNGLRGTTSCCSPLAERVDEGILGFDAAFLALGRKVVFVAMTCSQCTTRKHRNRLPSHGQHSLKAGVIQCHETLKIRKHGTILGKQFKQKLSPESKGTLRLPKSSFVRRCLRSYSEKRPAIELLARD